MSSLNAIRFLFPFVVYFSSDDFVCSTLLPFQNYAIKTQKSWVLPPSVLPFLSWRHFRIVSSMTKFNTFLLIMFLLKNSFDFDPVHSFATLNLREIYFRHSDFSHFHRKTVIGQKSKKKKFEKSVRSARQISSHPNIWGPKNAEDGLLTLIH